MKKIDGSGAGAAEKWHGSAPLHAWAACGGVCRCVFTQLEVTTVEIRVYVTIPTNSTNTIAY